MEGLIPARPRGKINTMLIRRTIPFPVTRGLCLLLATLAALAAGARGIDIGLCFCPEIANTPAGDHACCPEPAEERPREAGTVLHTGTWDPPCVELQLSGGGETVRAWRAAASSGKTLPVPAWSGIRVPHPAVQVSAPDFPRQVPPNAAATRRTVRLQV